MLKELFDLVSGTAQYELPDERTSNQKDEVVAEATNTVASGLRNIVAGGGVQSLLGLFGSGSDKKNLLGNPIVAMMVGHFANKLMNKFNMNSNQAGNVAGNLIPGVLGNLVNRVNDPSDNTFSLDNLLGSITGGQATQVAQERGGGLMDLLTGSSPGGNGGGIMDIIGQLAGGAQQQQQRNGGSLLDLIKGFAK